MNLKCKSCGLIFQTSKELERTTKNCPKCIQGSQDEMLRLMFGETSKKTVKGKSGRKKPENKIFPSLLNKDPLPAVIFKTVEERNMYVVIKRYVALTRAKKQAFLVTRQNRDSMFAVELMSDSLIDVVTLDSANSENPPVQTCTKCKKGVMVIRTGPYSNFLGCSRFPKCVHKTKIR